MTAVVEVGNGCPGLASLQAIPISDEVRSHADGCAGCSVVLEILASRSIDIGCSHYEFLLALRDDGTINDAGRNLLERHLASCRDCRELSDTLAPTELGHFETLPNVDPADYTIDREINRGGMGRILAAHDLRIGRPVAVKELLKRSPHLATRFEREARLTARLQHPGIIPIYEIGKWPDGTPFYTMRMVEGRTLRDAITKASTLRARMELLPSLIVACEAVAFAHSRRIIHRDLTPSNILIGDYGETVVIDWGLAKDLTSTEADDSGTEENPSSLTSAGAILGTYAYMPPEQAKSNLVDERADVYALGAILYHLLSGGPPFRGLLDGELKHAAQTTSPQPIQDAARGSPLDLISIVSKAMARSPEDRYPTARELAEELHRFQTGRLVEAHTYSRGQKITRFIRRNRKELTITAAAVIVLASVAVISVRNVLRSKNEARATARALLLEEGRVEMLADHPLRALAYLHEAEQQGIRDPALPLLLGQALGHLASAEVTLECGDDDRLLALGDGGRLIAAACYDEARIWRVTPTGIELVHRLPGATRLPGAFVNVKFSHDAKTLATWGNEGILRLWDVATGVERRLGSADNASINAASFTPDDRRVATFDEGGFARVYDSVSGNEVRAIQVVRNPIGAFRRLHGAIDHTGTRLLTLTFTGSAHGFTIEDGKDLGGYEFEGLLGGGDISADATRVVACRIDGVVEVIDTDGKLLQQFHGYTDSVWKCVFNADGTRVLTGSHDGTAKVWDISRPSKPARLLTTVYVGDPVWSVRFSPDGRRFVTLTPGKHMRVWDTASGDLLATYRSRGKDAWFLPDNRLVAARGDGRIDVWRAATSRLVAYSPGDASVVAVTPDADALVVDRKDGVFAIRPDGTDLAPLGYPVATARHRIAGAVGAEIAIVDVAGAQLARLPVGRDRPARLVFSGDGSKLAAVWADRAEIWDIRVARRLLALPGVDRVLLSDDGARAAAWWEADDGTPKPPTQPVIWDVGTAAPIATLPTLAATPIGFARGGDRLVAVELSSGSAPMVSIWNTNAELVIRIPNVSIRPTIDPTGRWVTTVDQEREVAVWDADDGARRSVFSGDQLQLAQANDDGTLLVAVGDYGRVAMILSASDGRVLARHVLEHDRANVRSTSFLIPTSTAWWTTDSSAIAALGIGVGAWNVRNPYDGAKAAELIRKYVPYTVENGQLVPKKNNRIVGQIVRDGSPVERATVVLSMRRPADAGLELSWDSMAARHSVREARSSAVGGFEIEDLTGGEIDYSITISAGSDRVTCEDILVGPDTGAVDVDLTTRSCRQR